MVQLKCIGGNAKGLYEVDLMRCKNQGSDYDEENVQWTCSASLPSEFKLGSTDVICEGFTSSNDPYVLKGSCGVEYRLILTAAGEERYGRESRKKWESNYEGNGRSSFFIAIIFWCLFISVLGWITYSASFNNRGGIRPGGGGMYWGGGGNDDPPPPYDYHPQPKTSTWRARTAGQEGWRPGFWSGVLGGTAAGYMAGNRTQNQQTRNAGSVDNQQRNDSGWLNNNNGERSSWGSGGRTRSSASSTPSNPSTRHESSGFGSTTRR